MAVYLSTLCNEVFKRVLKTGDTMTGNLTMDARIHGKPDSASAPTFSWSNDSNTGFYNLSQHHIGVTCAGSLTYTLNAGRQIFENNKVLAWKTSNGTTTDILYVDPVNRVRLFSPFGDMYVNESGTNTCHINYNNTGKFMMYNGTTPILASSGNNIGIGTITPSSALHVIGVINASTTLQQGGSNVNVMFAPSNHTHSADAITGTIPRNILPTATNSLAGAVVLNDSTTDSSTTTAATANAVRLAYARADGAKTTADAALPKSGGTMTGQLNTGVIVVENNTYLKWKNASGTPVNVIVVDNGNATKINTAGGSLSLNGDQSSSDTNINYNNNGNVVLYNGYTAVLTKNGSRIGIGTTTPKAPLEVVGTVGSTLGNTSGRYFDSYNNLTFFNSEYGATWSIFASSYYGGSGFTAISDKRIKNDVERILPDMETLLKLRPVTYKYIDRIGYGTQMRYGFIAQELEDLLPGLVYGSEDFVPDIYRIASYSSDTCRIVWSKDEFGKYHDGDEIKSGDTLKLIAKKDNDTHLIVNVISSRIIDDMMHVVIEHTEKLTKEVFVYGRKVTDFKNINYDDVMSWSVAQLQHIYKLHLTDREKIAILEDRIQETSKLEDRVQRLEQLLAKI